MGVGCYPRVEVAAPLRTHVETPAADLLARLVLVRVVLGVDVEAIDGCSNLSREWVAVIGPYAATAREVVRAIDAGDVGRTEVPRRARHRDAATLDLAGDAIRRAVEAAGAGEQRAQSEGGEGNERSDAPHGLPPCMSACMRELRARERSRNDGHTAPSARCDRASSRPLAQGAIDRSANAALVGVPDGAGAWVEVGP